MANKIYDNYFLSNEIEDQFDSKLDLMGFVTVDRTLEGTAGMTRKINIYKATGGAEKLDMGEGNTKVIEVEYTDEEYKILLAQSRFNYYDEELMTDPTAIDTGIDYMATDMFNTVNADIFAEFRKATQTVSTENFDFGSFVEGQAILNSEDVEGLNTFAFIHPLDYGNLRKNLKDDLKYVESFSRFGYLGTVGGTNIYQKKNAVRGEMILATNEAVTVFLKKGTEVEQVTEGTRSESAANIRQNSIFCRKYYLPALRKPNKVVKITLSGGSI